MKEYQIDISNDNQYCSGINPTMWRKMIHSKLPNIMPCGNQSARDFKESCSVNMDA